jgi:serine/threonine-protein kinase RIO1
MSGGPWKKVQGSEGKAQPVPLSEIMSEELAKKIQAEEEGESTTEKQDQEQGQEQEQEQQQPPLPEVTQKEAEQLVSDEELARQLQTEEDDAALARRIAATERPTAAAAAPPKRQAATEDGDEDEDVVLERGVKVYHQGSKTHVRMTAAQAAKVGATHGAKKVTTKHDPTIAGRRNADQMDKWLESGDMRDELSLPNRAANALREHARRSDARAARIKEASSDPARTELVLDTATRVTMLSLLNQDIITDLSGVIATGKEANIYHAFSGPALSVTTKDDVQPGKEEAAADQTPPELAIKVFKTIHEFRGRDIYIDGDFLAQYSRARLRPQKVIRLWAQKELRNLGRMHRAGVRCPLPIGLYGHDVLVMQFLGEEKPAPQIRDVSAADWSELYAECVRQMRRMFIGAKLVHADLSEFNMLLWRGELWVIDVAQAVPNDHVNATTFLTRDCRAVTVFFREKRGVATLTIRELYEFVTDPSISADEEPARLAALLERATARGPLTAEMKADEDVFASSTAPRNLSDIRDEVEFDARVKAGDQTAISQLTPQGLHQEPLPKTDIAPTKEETL